MEVAELESKYEKLSTTTTKVDPKERAEIRKKREGFVREWRIRKRKCKDMLETILENYQKKKEELYDEIGIETDEDVGVVIPPA